MLLIPNYKMHKYFGFILFFQQVSYSFSFHWFRHTCCILRYTCEPYKHFAKVLILFKEPAYKVRLCQKYVCHSFDKCPHSFFESQLLIAQKETWISMKNVHRFPTRNFKKHVARVTFRSNYF